MLLLHGISVGDASGSRHNFLVILFAHGTASPSLTAATLLGAALVLSDAFRARCRCALRRHHNFYKSVLRTGLRRLRSLPLRSKAPL